jgi:Kef-type K+ transport system membrane component KefB
MIRPEFWASMAVMMTLAYILGKLAEKVGQTEMVGRMVVGIVFGMLLQVPGVREHLYGAQEGAAVAMLATVGLTIFQALCGLEINGGHLTGHSFRIMLMILVAGLVCPMTCGAALGLWLAPTYCPEGVPTGVFAAMCGLFLSLTSIVAISLSIEPFGLKDSREASLCLTAATFEDVIAWVLVGVVMLFLPGNGHAGAGGEHHSIGKMLVGSVVILLLAFCIVKPLLSRFLPKVGKFRDRAVIFLAGMTLFAAATDAIGMHGLIGAMLWGGIFPRKGGASHEMENKLGDFVVPFFVTVFLIKSGLSCKWDMTWGDALNGVLIVIVATASKFGACTLAARYGSWDRLRKDYMLSWRSALVIGVCMNTRGLMTLMLLSVALEAGVIENRLFTLMLIQALVTTAMTSWALHALKAKSLAPEPLAVHETPSKALHAVHV